MAKTKETRIALKGENPKKARKISETARKAPPHTEEIQVVSDSEESNSESSSGSESNSDAEKRKNTKKPRLDKVKETEPADPPVPDDTSDDDSSDDDDSTSSSSSDGNEAIKSAKSKAKAKGAPAAVEANGAVHKTTKTASSTSSEESSSDSDDSDSDVGPEPQKVRKTAAASKSASKSESESDEPHQAPPKPKSADKNSTVTAPQSAPAMTATSVPPQPFTAPAGYKPVDMKRANISTTASLLSNPESKEIWHITAPSSVPLVDIKNVSLATIVSHQSVLSHKGTDYNLVEDTNSAREHAHTQLLVPSEKDNGYATANAPITKTLHLQQMVRLAHLPKKQADPATGADAAAKVNQVSHRTPRPQPKGLKMRFRPIGFGAGDPGKIGSDSEEDNSDVEMTGVDTAPSQTFKLPTSQPHGSAKRKREGEADDTPRKDKKRKKEKDSVKKSDKEDLVITDPLGGDESVVATSSKQGRKDAAKAQAALVEGTVAENPETAEERARKKEEKKRRKIKTK